MKYALVTSVMTSVVAFVVATTPEPKKPETKPEPRVYIPTNANNKCPAYPLQPVQTGTEYSDENNFTPYKHCVCGYGVYAEHIDKVGRNCTYCGRAEEGE